MITIDLLVLQTEHSPGVVQLLLSVVHALPGLPSQWSRSDSDGCLFPGYNVNFLGRVQL